MLDFRDHYFDTEARATSTRKKALLDLTRKSTLGQKGIRDEARYKTNMARIPTSVRFGIPREALPPLPEVTEDKT